MYYFILFSSLIALITARSSGLLVVLSFDDNLIEHFNFVDELELHNFRGTFYVNSGRLSTTSRYMTFNQAIELQKRGHELGGHTINHLNLLTSSNEVRIEQICGDKQMLENAGLNITSFAFPFGSEFDNAEIIFNRCKYRSARDSGGIQTPTSCNGCPTYLNVPLQERFLIRSVSYRVDTGNDPIISIINKGIEDVTQNSLFGAIVLVFHEIGNFPNESTSITLDNFRNLLQYISLQNDVAVVTTTDLLQNNFEQFFKPTSPTSSTTSSPTSSTFNTEALSSPSQSFTPPPSQNKEVTVVNSGIIVAIVIISLLLIVFVTACVYNNVTCQHKNKANVEDATTSTTTTTSTTEIDLNDLVCKTTDDISKQFENNRYVL